MAPARYGTARRSLRLAVCLLLAGCLDLAGGSGAPDALRSVAFYDGAVTVTGPRGYCIDPGSIRRDDGGRFALLASCESLTGESDLSVYPAVMTLAVLPRADAAVAPDAAAMARALGPGVVRRREDGDDITLVQVAEGGETVMPGGDPAHWRADLMINGHIVGLAAYGPEGGDIAGPRGRDLLYELAAGLRHASGSAGTESGG